MKTNEFSKTMAIAITIAITLRVVLNSVYVTFSKTMFMKRM